MEPTPKGFQFPIPSFRWARRNEKGEVVDDMLGQQQQLVGDLTYISGKGERLVVPSGFLTDYASIPNIFWNIPGFDPEGPAKFPAVLHDYLYFLRGGSPYFKTRRECDDIFLEAMQLVGVSYVHRKIIWLSVRVFGGIYSASQPWNKNGNRR